MSLLVVFAQSREAACATIEIYVEVASSLGLMMNFSKSKFMVIGSAMFEDDQ